LKRYAKLPAWDYPSLVKRANKRVQSMQRIQHDTPAESGRRRGLLLEALQKTFRVIAEQHGRFSNSSCNFTPIVRSATWIPKRTTMRNRRPLGATTEFIDVVRRWTFSAFLVAWSP
jgi:hypothetical protein